MQTSDFITETSVSALQRSTKASRFSVKKAKFKQVPFKKSCNFFIARLFKWNLFKLIENGFLCGHAELVSASQSSLKGKLEMPKQVRHDKVPPETISR